MATQVAPDTRPEAQGAQPSTIPRLWQDAIEQERNRPAYLVERGAAWEPVSWAEAATAVEELANGLLALGVRKGDAFGILGHTSLEWALFDFALAHVGAVGAAIYANSTAKDCEYILDHSESVGVLVEDGAQLEKLDDYRARNPRLEHVLTFADLDDLRARGRDYALAHPGALGRVVADVSPDDVFTYIYTSGTTGPPKACTILHRNYYAMAAVVDQIDDFTMSEDTMLLYLPLAHNFGRLMHLQGP
ncbi:MAG TPA: AMP-binding protein, partial [Gaiellaceae bacterium]|nr:AMP-binding protein [Gaiellaceae bacterium]